MLPGSYATLEGGREGVVKSPGISLRGPDHARQRRRHLALAVSIAGDQLALKHDPEKWIPVFRKRSCSIKELDRDDEST